MNYTCDACGKEGDPRDWLALRIAGDRHGLEIRTFEDSGPDDRFVCGEACALTRVSEILGGMRRDISKAPPGPAS